MRRQYETQVGSRKITVKAASAQEALSKAIDIWHQREGLFSRWQPAAYILSSKPVK